MVANTKDLVKAKYKPVQSYSSIMHMDNNPITQTAYEESRTQSTVNVFSISDNEDSGGPVLQELHFDVGFGLPSDEGDEGDVFFQLAQKEKYLLLAAEAGKELLEKNTQLKKQYELMQTEYAAKVEELEQERFTLRKELMQREELHDSRIQELNFDIENMKKQVTCVQESSHTLGKYHKRQLEEMGEQNEFLQSQFEQVKQHNQDLSFQVNTLRKRIEGRSGLNGFLDGDSRGHGEGTDARLIREQLAQLQQQKRHLEETIAECIAEKENATNECEAYKLKVVSLDQELAEMKQKVSLCQEELDESRNSNSVLKEQLEEYIVRAPLNATRQHNNSLYNELELTLSETDMSMITKLQGSTPMRSFQPLVASSQHGLNNLKRRRNLSHDDNDDDDDDDGDEEYVVSGGILSLADSLPVSDKAGNASLKEPQSDLRECYNKLSRLNSDLRNQLDFSDSESTHSTPDKPYCIDNVNPTIGQLLMIVDSVQDLVNRRVLISGCQRQNSCKFLGLPQGGEDNFDSISQTSGSHISQRETDMLEQQVAEVNQKLNESRQEIDKCKKQITILKNSLREKENDVDSLTRKVNFQDRELRNFREERDLLLSTESIEDTVKKAIVDRDQALQRENNCLQELEQMQSDMKKLNNQLVDAIQEKIELSEQLDEWQVDMATMIEKQLTSKMKGDNKKGKRRPFFNTRWSWSVPRTPIKD